MSPLVRVVEEMLEAAAAALGADDLTNAAERLGAALARNSKCAPAHALLGVVRKRQGDLTGALSSYRQALRLAPDDVEARFNMGVALLAVGRPGEAERSFAAVLRRDPGFAEAHLNLGQLALARGDIVAARRAFATATELRPDWGLAWFNLGVAASSGEDFVTALDAYGRAAAAMPNDPRPWNNRGNLLRQLGRLEEAEASLRHALAVAPGFADTLNNLGIVLMQQLRFDDAIACYDHVLALDPQASDSLFNKGLAHHMAGAVGEAMALYRLALAADPSHADASNNLGNALREQGQLGEASTAYAAAVAAWPVSAVAHHNLGQSLLQLGDFAHGWPEYDWRWQCADFPSAWRPYRQPLWQGEGLIGRTILVWREQGIGDEVLYSSMIPDLLARGGQVVLEASSRLAPLFRRSFPGVTVVTREEIETSSLLEGVDVHCPIASLGRWLRSRAEDFPRHQGYLKCDSGRREALAQRYRALGKPVIGIAWHSRASGQAGAKSSSLQDWQPVLSVADHVFVNLQYGDVGGELSGLHRRHGLSVFADPEVDQLVDLEGFAAQVAAMDLVVTVSNTTAHFAGALGIPALVMVPHGPGLFWYWFIDRDDSPWYPSLTVMRQNRSGDWATVLAAVADWLRNRRDEKSA